MNGIQMNLEMQVRYYEFWDERALLRGEKRGEKRGIQLANQVFKLYIQKKTEQEIADECSITVEKVREILE